MGTRIDLLRLRYLVEEALALHRNSTARQTDAQALVRASEKLLAEVNELRRPPEDHGPVSSPRSAGY